MAAEPQPIALPFQEAIDYLLRKLLLPTARWTDLWQEQHAVAFTVAGATSMAIVQDFHAAVMKSIAEGGTLAEFRRDFDAIVAKHGWTYNGSRGWRSRVIFETNLRMAYSAGKWQQAQESAADRPYLRYSAILDGRTRPLHRQWHGTILPIGDAWWRTHMPPNGWNCRCTVMTLSERDLARRGWTVSGMPPGASRWVDVPGRGKELVPDGIDPGFAYNPGEANLAMRAARLAQRQADRLPKALQEAGKATMAEAAQRAAAAAARQAPAIDATVAKPPSLPQPREFASLDAADASLTEAYRPWAERLSKEEADALRDYKGSDYYGMNRHMRGLEEDALFVPPIEALDAALGRARVPEDLRVWRGTTGVDAAGWRAMAVGQVRREDAFTSTSLNPTKSREFADAEDGLLLEILIPAGYKGAAYVQRVPQLQSREHELLFASRTRFRVVAVEADRMVVEVLRGRARKPAGAPGRDGGQ